VANLRVPLFFRSRSLSNALNDGAEWFLKNIPCVLAAKLDPP
jgi:hypothetical protein